LKQLEFSFRGLVFAVINDVFKLNPEELDVGVANFCHGCILLLEIVSLQNREFRREQYSCHAEEKPKLTVQGGKDLRFR
jgi:hypothetical protein